MPKSGTHTSGRWFEFSSTDSLRWKQSTFYFQTFFNRNMMYGIFTRKKNPSAENFHISHKRKFAINYRVHNLWKKGTYHDKIATKGYEMVGLEWFSRAAFTLASLKKYQKSPLSLLAMASYTSVYTVLPIKFDMNVIFSFSQT